MPLDHKGFSSQHIATQSNKALAGRRAAQQVSGSERCTDAGGRSSLMHSNAVCGVQYSTVLYAVQFGWEKIHPQTSDVKFSCVWAEPRAQIPTWPLVVSLQASVSLTAEVSNLNKLQHGCNCEKTDKSHHVPRGLNSLRVFWKAQNVILTETRRHRRWWLAIFPTQSRFIAEKQVRFEVCSTSRCICSVVNDIWVWTRAIGKPKNPFQKSFKCYQLIHLCSLHAGHTNLKHRHCFVSNYLQWSSADSSNQRKMPKRVFQNILFGADGPRGSRVAGRPTLKITKRDCGRTIRWAKLGFPTSPGECISHTHTQSGTKY